MGGNLKNLAIRPDALLLIGPTGSGKSPLGDYLEASGIFGRCCCHFDFGSRLRHFASTGLPATMTDKEAAVINNSLASGSILESSDYGIAVKLFEYYLETCCQEKECLIVLNGFPRDVEQASFMDGYLNVVSVLELDACRKVVWERIKKNTGGDRAGRRDDNAVLIKKKVQDYRSRTSPLLDFYRKKSVRVCSVPIQVGTDPGEIVNRVKLI